MTSTHTHTTLTHTIHIHYLCECTHAFAHSQANVVLYCVSLTTYSSINLSPYRWYKIISRNVNIHSWLLNKPSNFCGIITTCIVKWRHILNTSSFVICIKFYSGKVFLLSETFLFEESHCVIAGNPNQISFWKTWILLFEEFISLKTC